MPACIPGLSQRRIWPYGLRRLDTLLPPCVQALRGGGIDQLWERLHVVAVEAEDRPAYAALLLSSGLLAHGLQLGKRMAREKNDEPLPVLVSCRLFNRPGPAVRFGAGRCMQCMLGQMLWSTFHEAMLTSRP